MKKLLETKQPLTGRTKLLYELEVKGATPKNVDVSKQIAENAKAKEELIVIKKINHEFGKTKVLIEAYVYNNLDLKTKFERINNKRTLEAEKKAKEEAEKPAETKEEPAKAEVVKEEVKTEEKPKEVKDGKEESSEQKTE